MELRFWNTMGREMQAFQPITPGAVGMYCCGPTVYDFAHIGNLRTYVFEDILRRTLEYAGYTVRHVMNVTDVGHLTGDSDDGEDKMLKGAREKGKTVWEIAEFYTRAFFRDFELLRCTMPTVICRATEHIQEMIDLISRIEKKGFTYSAGGNVYFDISRFPGYGKLALLDQQDLKAGARIAVDEGKRNPADFALWFTKSKFEHQAMMWDSPWGRGYPGWHIECSAMSMKYLGEHFDIHCGGADHPPVHHSNEIAQSEAATGSKWVNYWMHGEWLLMDKEKMAKSAGNFTTLSTLTERGFHPMDYRYFCLGAHYRTQLAFSWEAMEAARSGRKGVEEKLVQLRAEGSEPAAEITGPAAEYLRDFDTHVADDLNMPRCLADLWTLLRDSTIPAAQKLGAALRMDRVFGLGLADARAEELSLDPETRALVDQREAARKARDFKKADELRALLLSKGIEVQDGPKGPKVRIAAGQRR
ncbi:MAG TPA: cysteine--tRNA ligase [Spirochaetia bacterium]|nr:cysteine--tRNA ligase [Spirochaetia bacterium]